VTFLYPLYENEKLIDARGTTEVDIISRRLDKKREEEEEKKCSKQLALTREM
jgi:hypothetical protein